MGLFKKEVKQSVRLADEELKKWKEMIKQASDQMWMNVGSFLDKSIYRKSAVRFYPDIANLVDELIKTEEISGELLGRIGRVLGDRWRDKNGDN